MNQLEVSTRQFTIATDDDRGLHCRRWGPESPPICIVVVHGLGEHSGCYDEFGEAMSDQDIGVFAYDQHGHGKSPGTRGHAPSLDTFIEDIQTVCFRVADECPNGEIVLLGHSMGGHFVLRFLLDINRPPIDRAVVTNPMILPKNPPTKPQSFAAWLTSKIVPRLRVSASIEPTELTSDAEQLKRLADDPLLHEQLSIGVGGKLMSSGHHILDSASELHSDLLFLIGKEDNICDDKTSQAFCETCGDRCTTQRFAGMKHSLLLEKDRQLVFNTIAQWLQ